MGRAWLAGTKKMLLVKGLATLLIGGYCLYTPQIEFATLERVLKVFQKLKKAQPEILFSRLGITIRTAES